MQYCEDPDEAGNYRRPLIIDKNKIESGECPQVDDNMEDIEIEKDGRDRCDDCPYCDKNVSCIITGLIWFRYLPTYIVELVEYMSLFFLSNGSL